MNFLLQIHRSIIEPSFYADAVTVPVKKAVFYLVKLIALTVLIVTLAQIGRIMDKERGLPYLLPAMFPDMQVAGYGMTSAVATPYLVNPLYVKKSMALLLNLPEALMVLDDSAVVVDTHRTVAPDKMSSTLMVLSPDTCYLLTSQQRYFKVPYSLLVSENEVIVFTKDGISRYLHKRVLGILFQLFILNSITFLIPLLMSIILLAFATFIFGARMNVRFSTSCKLALYAITPHAVGTIFSALAGVQFIWLWHITIFISIVILYRAIIFLSQNGKNNSSGDTQWD